MSLVVWFPLNNNVNNQGTTTLSMTSLSGSTLSNTGKVTRYCYGNTSFTGGGYVSSQQITLGQNQSIFAWVKFSSLTSDSSLGGSIAGQHRYPSNVGMGMTLKYVSSTTGYLSVNTGNGSARTFNTYCGSTLLQANTWYHLGYTYDGSTIRLYVNGVLDGSHNFTGMSTPADYFMIGCWSFSGSSGNSVYGNYKLNGYINDLRAYNHTLSIKEIKELAKGLALHYKFNFEDLYVPVEYIQSSASSTNSGQFIDTGWTYPNTGIITLESKFAFTKEESQRALCGIQKSGYGQQLYVYRPSSSTIQTYLGGVGGTTINLPSTGQIINLKLELNVSTTTASFSVNNTTLTYSYTNDIASNSLRIFSGRQGDVIEDCSSLKMYSFKILENGNPVRDYIPCIRKCDSKPGLFDLVTYNFYTNSGSGEFTYPSTTVVAQVPDASGYGNNASYKSACSTTGTTPIGSTSLICPSTGVCVPYNLPMNQYTIAMWFKLGATGKMPLGSNTTSSNNSNFYCFGDNSWKYVTSAGSQEYYYQHNGGAVSTSNYVFWVATYDGTNTKIYRNGVYEGSQAVTTSGATVTFNNISIGFGFSDTSYWTTNEVAEFRLYATALSQADITELYKTKESIDKKGNLYCNTINELGNSMSFKKSGIIECNSITEGFNKTSLQGAYTQLEYIKTNGNQIINTGVADTLRTTVDLDMQVDSGIGQYWYGSTQNSGSMMYNGLYNITALEYNWLTISRTSNNRCIMTQRLNGNNITITMNGVTSTVSVGSTAPTGNLYIFGCNNGNRYYGTGILCRYFRIYQDNVLVRDFIPVKRNKDNAIGMLDLVHNTFYANAGTGSFTAGNEINKKYAIYTNNIIEN